MTNLETCIERCPIVANLPEAVRLQILGSQAIHLCPAELPHGLLGPLCGLPSSEAKNLATREALRASKEVQLSTV